MNRARKLLLAAVVGGCALLFFSGCENVSVGVGYSNYDPRSGMGYSIGVSQGPYGTHGYSSMSMYGRF